MQMELKKLEDNFKNHEFLSEDDIKIHFYSEIIHPLLMEMNPSHQDAFHSEKQMLTGERPDATFQNIAFEYKKKGYFSKKTGQKEALYGRNEKDHGLYDYLISMAGLTPEDKEDVMVRKLLSGVGVGFDGESFLFARFVPSMTIQDIEMSKQKGWNGNDPMLPIEFQYEPLGFKEGLRRLAFLVKQQDKIALRKDSLLAEVNPKTLFVRENITAIYDELVLNLHSEEGSSRVRTLYKEWNQTFGKMYGDDEDATSFTEVSSYIRETYGYGEEKDIDSKEYLFALQTFFNMFLKLLVYAFLSQLVSPTFKAETMTKQQVDKLFDGKLVEYESMIGNFFEPHFLEWFTYAKGEDGFEEKVANNIMETIGRFDLSTYVLKPEDMQDILQEVYMELIPPKMRHLMGEYFSPDWVVEHALDMAGFDGDIEKSLADPAAGSGTFLTHAIKRIIREKGKKISWEDVVKITQNVVGFDINPISVIAAKANYILVVFSACEDSVFDKRNWANPVDIPVYIADSVLAPVVYSEENGDSLSIDTTSGTFVIPKFGSYTNASAFMRCLEDSIETGREFEAFWGTVKQYVNEDKKQITRKLFCQIYSLHRCGNDSFWPAILRNSFAPILINREFDYVVGNPPWIAWKSMSKSYRTGTIEVWKSYGIFEKNAYDKKTTHDDFGMAVTYVAIDRYLKDGGIMVFLLPLSFLKSTKGGEGFRKFTITRKGQDQPFSIEEVDDFSRVSLFSIPTVAVKIKKGKQMRYPLHAYKVWVQNGGKKKIDSHAKWDDVKSGLTCKNLSARPADTTDIRSPWLTLEDMEFADKALNSTVGRIYSGRKGIEPAGAKGIYLLKKPVKSRDGLLLIENCIERQKREDFLKKGAHKGKVEDDFIYPMLGGRNIERWRVKSNEFMLVPHTAQYRYGVPQKKLEDEYPMTAKWLWYYHDELLASRKQNGKFFNPNEQPYYRLDNVGKYTFAPWKVLWKEQTGSMAAVVVGSYFESIPDADKQLFSMDKPIVADSKVLMLALEDSDEAYYVGGVLNAKDVVEVIDGYAIPTNRGTDVLKYLAIPKYNPCDKTHKEIARISRGIHEIRKFAPDADIEGMEENLNAVVRQLF